MGHSRDRSSLRCGDPQSLTPRLAIPRLLAGPSFPVVVVRPACRASTDDLHRRASKRSNAHFRIGSTCATRHVGGLHRCDPPIHRNLL